MKKNKLYTITTAAVLLIGLAAWSYTKTAPKTSLNTTKEINQTEPVHLKDAEGHPVNISDFKGKVVFINNWATWCRPCTMEMPSVQKLKDHFKGKDLVFVMISYDRSPQTSINWMKNQGYTLPVYSRGKDLPQKYITRGIPATFVLDQNGALVYRHVGMHNYSSPAFLAKMEKWLKK